MQIGDFPYVRQGWQCPVCCRACSPFTQMCFYCQTNGQQTVITNDRTVPVQTPIRDIMTGKTDLTQMLGGDSFENADT